MRHRLVLAALFFLFCLARLSLHTSFAQSPESEPSSVLEIPPPLPESPTPPTQPNEVQLLEQPAAEQEDAVTRLGELRGAVRVSPEDAGDRLKLARGLYRIGDLDAALDECRIAIKLDPTHAAAHLQLGITLMAKQDGRAAAAALMESIVLDPTLAQAHYSLGSVQYSLGNLPAAIQSYRRGLELQPHFPDARYRLALVLKLTNRHQEAAQFMEEAAAGGIPQAQFFTGNAYRSGQGVEKNLAQAIGWWMTAVEFGHQRAAESLSQLRRQALSSDQPERRRNETLNAFRQYREQLWNSYPDVVRYDHADSLGAALLTASDSASGIPLLLREALALSEPAHDELARLYEYGLDSRLAQFDSRILACFETIAADGFIPAKKTLARIYGKGLGVTADVRKAKALLKGLSKQDTKLLLDEIAGR